MVVNLTIGIAAWPSTSQNIGAAIASTTISKTGMSK